MAACQTPRVNRFKKCINQLPATAKRMGRLCEMVGPSSARRH